MRLALSESAIGERAFPFQHAAFAITVFANIRKTLVHFVFFDTFFSLSLYWRATVQLYFGISNPVIGLYDTIYVAVFSYDTCLDEEYEC